MFGVLEDVCCFALRHVGWGSGVGGCIVWCCFKVRALLLFHIRVAGTVHRFLCVCGCLAVSVFVVVVGGVFWFVGGSFKCFGHGDDF